MVLIGLGEYFETDGPLVWPRHVDGKARKRVIRNDPVIGSERMENSGTDRVRLRAFLVVIIDAASQPRPYSFCFDCVRVSHRWT
jgi:hypothetical protein